MSKDNGDFVGHYQCIGNECSDKHDCHSSDGLAIYQHSDEENNITYDGFCWSCNQFFSTDHINASSIAPELGIEGGVVVDKTKVIAKPKKEPMTKDEVIEFIKNIGYVGKGARSIKDEYNQFFGHLTKLDNSGNPIARFYPETEGGKVIGYKSRIFPKKFGILNRGRTGIKSDLSGQVKFKSGGKYLLICGGEEDKVAAFQMLRDNQIKRGQGDFEPIAVVSPTTGESSAVKQIAAQYDFCNLFEFIVLGFDNDDVGKAAMAEIAKVLPSDKVKIASWSLKDPNKMLEHGKQDQFVREFYSAKDHVDTGIKMSSQLMPEVMNFLDVKKLTLPPYMYKMQENMRGGIGYGRVVNIIADTSVGKSSHINNMVYHFIFNSPDPVGIISLEATAAEYAMEMLSIHLEQNLSWFKSGDEVKEFLNRSDVVEKANELFILPDGRPRFYIVDEREGKIKVVENQMERMFKQYGTKVLIVDVLSDLLRSLDNAEQERHMMYQKLFVKHGAIIINALHTRKPPADKEGKQRKATEYDAIGSSSFVQSAHINIVLNRDKMSTDPIEKNTTIADMPKCRGGITGEAGRWYYDYKTRNIYDLQDWLSGAVENNTEKAVKEISEVYYDEIF